MSVEPDKSAGCPTESDRSSIECGDCVKSDNVDSDEKKKIPRSVHFPDEGEVVTRYFEPANPWHNVPMTSRAQLAAEYLESCRRHNTPCIDGVLQQIRELPEASIGGVIRAPRLTLSECALLGPAPADALEAVLRKVQFRRIEIDHAEIDDEGAEALFDMVEYYESATVICISGPRQFGIRGWQAASRMIKKSAELSELEVTDSALEASHSPVLARSLRPVTCRLRALCLQRVALCGEPLLCLVIALKSNNSIRELRLGDNRLSIPDAAQLATLLKYNNRIQLLDLSNNQIQDAGVGQIADALAEQAAQSPPSAAASPLSPHRCQVGGHEARGLAFLVLWNNQLTRNCAPHISKALRSCASLCVLNVGRNALGSDVPRAACAGSALVSLGLQAARLGPDAAQALAELIRHHTRLQRLDLRENRLGSLGLQAILSVMKDNTTLTQIDLDEPPESTNLLAEDSETSLVRRLTREIRTLCLRNEPMGRADDQDPMHRKISLTCHTVCLLRQGMGGEEERRGRLRSPAPSPAPSPAGSPVPAPHPNSRFSVTRVTPERDPDATRPSTPTRPTYCHTPSRFRVVQVMEPPQIQVHPATAPRKSASRFSVTRNYDTMYNPSPSPPASPAYNPPIDPVTSSATTTVTKTAIPKVVTAPVAINPSFKPEVVRTVIDVPVLEETMTSREVKNDSKDDERRKLDGKILVHDSVKTRASAEIENLSLKIEDKAMQSDVLSTVQSEVDDRTQPEVCSESCLHEASSRTDIREIGSESSLHCEARSNVQADVCSKSNVHSEVSNRSSVQANVQAEVCSKSNVHIEVSNRPNVQTNIQAEVCSNSSLHTEVSNRPNTQTNVLAEVGSKSNVHIEVSNRPNMQTNVQAEDCSESNLHTEDSNRPNVRTNILTEVSSKSNVHIEASNRPNMQTNIQAEVCSNSNLYTEVSNRSNVQTNVLDSKSNLHTEVSNRPNLQSEGDKLGLHSEASKTDLRTEVISKSCLKPEVSYKSDSRTDIDSKSCSNPEVIKPNMQDEVSSKSNLQTEGSNKLNLQSEVDNKSSLHSEVGNISILQTELVDNAIVKSDVQTDAGNKPSLQISVLPKPVSTSNVEKDLQDKSGLQTDIDKKPVSQAYNQSPLHSVEMEKDIVKLKESATLVKNTSVKIEKLKDTCKKIILKETVDKCDIHITKNVSVPLKYDTQINIPEGSIQVNKDLVSKSENVPTTDVLNDPTLNKNVAGILKSDTTHKNDNETSKNESKTTNLAATSSGTHTTVVELSELEIETTFIDSTIARKDMDKEILKTDSISKIVSDCDVCDSSKDIILEKNQHSVNKSDTECKQPNMDVVSEKKDLSDKDKVIDSVKTVTSDLKYSDVVKNTIKHEQNTTMKQIVAITEDLGNIIKEMRTLVKDNVETPVKDIVLKKNKSESSLDSPDLEVSRLTEKMSSVFDSNSSLEISGSSMESLNEHNKTVQELDRRKAGVILSGSSLESDVTPINTNLLNLSVSSNDSVSPIFGKTRVIHDSLSSLEASVSSLDSGKQEKIMVTSADSGIEYSLQNPPENKEDNSSNEGTLTNNSSLKDTVKKPEAADGTTDSPKRASSLLDVPALKNKGLDRMRKISWVAPSSSFQVPKPDEKETKPSHLEKLLSLFQHPSSIFSRSSGLEDEKKSASNTPPRKDSTLTSSFWSWGSTIERDKEEDSSEATDSTLSERVQVCFVDESFSRKLDSKTPSTDTDNTLSEFQSFPQESESDRVTVTTEDNIVQKVDISVNSQDIDIAKTGAIDLLKEKETVNIEKEDIARPRSFAAVLKASGSENSLDKQNSPDNGQSVDKLPSKVIRGIKENISPENTLTSSMTNTKTLAEELERQVKTPPVLEVTLKNEPKLEDIKASELAPIATIEETEDIFTKIDDVKIDKDSSVDSGVVESDKKDKEIDLGKDALSYLMYENRDFDIGAGNLIKTTAQQGSLAQELKEAEIKEILDLSPELVIDEGVEDPVFSAKEIIRTSPIIPERAKLKKSNSLEDLSHVETEKTSPKIKTIVFKVPESTTPRDIPERRSKLRTRSGTSPKSLPESLNKPCPLSKMESVLTKKKKKVSSLGKIARDSLLALNMSEEEIAEFRRSYKLTSVESLKSLESVSEDANSQSGNSVDSRCRACLRTSQESLMSLDSITEDCRCTDDCEKPGRSVR